MMRDFTIPKYTTAMEIKETRKGLGLTQEEFAVLLGCSKPTVVRWENAPENITGPIVSAVYFLGLKDSLGKIELPPMKCPLRLKYMHGQNICTLIDVDEKNRHLAIKNYNDNFMFRAFGNVTSPSWTDYEDFLKSRCFPESRDKLKLVLDDLGIPFYDPMMIIEKTEGRMAEDDFWIDVVRKND